MPAWYNGPDPFNLGGSGGNDSSDDKTNQQSATNLSVDGIVSGATGVADWAAGSTDETVARQVDDQEGGGVADGVASFTGVTAYRQSENFQKRQEAYQNADGTLEKIDQRTKTGIDFFLDNPNASVQDTVRGGVEKATGTEDVGQAAQDLATQYRETTTETFEGTAVDNPVTDAVVWGADALVAEPAKAATTAATGVDIDEGTEEGTVGAVDVFDIALTGAGGAAAKGGLKAGRLVSKGDEAGTVASRLLGGSDEGGTVVSRLLGRGGDDAGQATNKLGQGTERFPSIAPDSPRPSVVNKAVKAADEGAAASDEGATGAAKEATQASDEVGSDIFGRLTIGDETASGAGRLDGVLGSSARVGEEAASGVRRGADDLASRIRGAADEFTTRLSRGSDKVGEAAAKSGDETPGLFSRATPSLGKSTKFGIGAGGTAVGAGAVANEAGFFDPQEAENGTRTEMADGTALVKEDNLSANPDLHPLAEDGATVWRVIEKDGTEAGLTVVVGQKGPNMMILKDNGSISPSRVSPQEWGEGIQRGRPDHARQQQEGDA